VGKDLEKKEKEAYAAKEGVHVYLVFLAPERKKSEKQSCICICKEMATSTLMNVIQRHTSLCSGKQIC
jgi:hypothetical protein